MIGLLQAIPAIAAGLKGKNTKSLKKTTGQLEQLADAQINMDNPLYQRTYEQNRASGQQDLAGTISEIGRQNRKLVSMGRTPLLDQERGGESIFRNLIKGQTDIGEQARQSTLSQLRGGQSAFGNIYNTQANLADEEWANRLKKVGAQYSIGDALKSLFGLSSRTEEPIRYGDINWNSERVV